MSGAASAAFRSLYDLAYQVSPIILQGGIVAGVPGGLLPIIGLTGQLAGFGIGAVSSGGLGLDDFPFHFLPIPGSTVINNAVGTYPFANQAVAANAIIEQPITISLQMIAPVNQTAGYLTKLPLFTSLRTSLQAHSNAGGTYMIATPSFIYSNCLMTGMADITSGEGKQQQIEWQLDFMRPLISLQAAASAYSSLMGKLVGGSKIAGQAAWSGPIAAAGTAAQGALASVAQGASGLVGAVNQFLAAPL